MARAEYSLRMPLWIDTDAYSDRDRQMFVAGVEFQMLFIELQSTETVMRTIRTENESRARMMANRLGRKAVVEPSGYEGWSYFTSPATERKQCGD
jgi:hypothetical protein